MLNVYLCHAAAERPLAESIARRLEQGAEARVIRDELPAGQTVNQGWEVGLGADAVLLVLSPKAVPARVKRDEWAGVLEHLEGNAEPPVAWVVAQECAYPPLVKRNTRLFFPSAELRAIERWVLSLHPALAGFAPARLPWFAGRETEMAQLWEWLVDEAGTAVICGPPGAGKSCLAQEFARQAQGHFRDIVWVGCGQRSDTFLGGELTRLADWEHRRRLLVMEDVAAQFAEIPSGKHLSVLMTARDDFPGMWTLYLDGEWRQTPGTPEDPDLLPLWEALTVCRPVAAPLELAAEIASISERAAEEVAERLVAGRWIDPVDGAGRLFRRGRGNEAEWLRRRHAEVLESAFGEWRTRPERCREWTPEWENAFRWAMDGDWRQAAALARRGFRFFKQQGWMYEALEVYEELLRAAELRGDEDVAGDCRYELSWIQGVDGSAWPAASGGEQLGFDFS